MINARPRGALAGVDTEPLKLGDMRINVASALLMVSDMVILSW
jgi:hypothetical protein